jgi:hypothetical protein
LLDILSHRMSAMAILQQLTTWRRVYSSRVTELLPSAHPILQN